MRVSEVLAVAIVAAQRGRASRIYPNASYGNITQNGLPVIDLGYGLFQATINITGQYYNFTNIPFAEPPKGKLRFKRPIPPQGRNTTIQTGQELCICHQSYPVIQQASAEFIGPYLKGENVSRFLNLSDPAYHLPPKPEPAGVTEDCLKLDVLVPKKVYDGRSSCAKSRGKGGVPVLVWIFGGGNVIGDKSGVALSGYANTPAGLLHIAQETKAAEGFIYVAMNYRLGAFGFLAGPSFTQGEGTPNAAYYDQRLALDWVKENIHLFGGDPDNVTIIGQSAGGSGVLHQITAYGGGGSIPFRRAISQSAGFTPSDSNTATEKVYKTFLSVAKVTSFDELANASEAVLAQANAVTCENASYGSFTYGPQVDGDFVPDLLSRLFLRGDFHKEVDIMLGHNGQEGLVFTPPYAQTPQAFDTYFAETFPESPQSFRDTVSKIYPDVLNSSQGFKNEINRTAVALADYYFDCNSVFAAHAFENQSYNYLFSVPPSLHGQDFLYTFFNGQAKDTVGEDIDPDIARAFQKYLLNFMASGDPNGPNLPQFNKYGEKSNVQNIGLGGLQDIAGRTDTISQERCAFWQTGPEFPDAD